MGLLCSLFSKTEISGISVCVSAKSYSLTLYEFFNRQDLSAVETERNAVFYSKHTAGSPFLRFSVQRANLCKSLRFSLKRHKKTARQCQHFCKQRICSGGVISRSSTWVLLYFQFEEHIFAVWLKRLFKNSLHQVLPAPPIVDAIYVGKIPWTSWKKQMELLGMA